MFYNVASFPKKPFKIFPLFNDAGVYFARPAFFDNSSVKEVCFYTTQMIADILRRYL